MNAPQTYWHNRRRHSRPVAQTTTAALEDATDAINTAGKYKGKLVTDLDTLKVYAAQGAAAVDVWRPVGVFNDSADITPA
jgi:2-keto-3-deoxy-L-rhamnonate aldolase RhmA